MAPAWFFGHLVAMVALHFGLPIAQWNVGASRWAGLPLALAGILLVGTGARRFHPVTTLDPRQQPSVLVTDGLHAWSRNPMYVGLLLSMAGAFVMLGSVGPGLALPVFYAVLRFHFVAWEERRMQERFGDAYREYCRRVRRWL